MAHNSSLITPLHVINQHLSRCWLFLYICDMNKLKNIGLFIIGLFQAIGVYILFVFDNASSILSIRTKPEFKSFYDTPYWQRIAIIRLLVFLLVYLAVIWI